MPMARSARVTVTLKDGELWFHGIALKPVAANQKAEEKVVELEQARRKRERNRSAFCCALPCIASLSAN